MRSRKLIFAASIAIAMGAVSAVAAAGTKSQDITDARQETQIWTTYALSPHLSANDLEVSVHNGKATLTGKVDETSTKTWRSRSHSGRRYQDRRQSIWWIPVYAANKVQNAHLS
jgi:HSP20 family molecular chaperone IbpA